MSDQSRQNPEKVEKQVQVSPSSANDHLHSTPDEVRTQSRQERQTIQKSHDSMVKQGTLPDFEIIGKTISEGTNIAIQGKTAAERYVTNAVNNAEQSVATSFNNFEKSTDHILRQGITTADQSLANINVPKPVRDFFSNSTSYLYGIGKGSVHFVGDMTHHGIHSYGKAAHDILNDPKAAAEALPLGTLAVPYQMTKNALGNFVDSIKPAVENFGNRTNNVGFGHALNEAAIHTTRDAVIGAQKTFDWLSNPKTRYEDVGEAVGHKVFPTTIAVVGIGGMLTGAIGKVGAAGAGEAEVGAAVAGESRVMAGQAKSHDLLGKPAEVPATARNLHVGETRPLVDIRGKIVGARGKYLEATNFKSQPGPDGSTINSFEYNLAGRTQHCLETISKDGIIDRIHSYKGKMSYRETLGKDGYITQFTSADHVTLRIAPNGKRFTMEGDPM